MKLYEINHQLEDLLLALEPDPETGEIPPNEDEIIDQIHSLAMERMDILQYLAKLALNNRADVAALKEEEKRLQTRRQHLEARQSRLIGLLDRECGGQKTDLGVATLSYRKASHVEITDAAAARTWLDENDRKDCYRIPAPEISKSAVSKLLDAGARIPGAKKVSTVSCCLK